MREANMQVMQGWCYPAIFWGHLPTGQAFVDVLEEGDVEGGGKDVRTGNSDFECRLCATAA